MKTLLPKEQSELLALRLLNELHKTAWTKHASHSKGGGNSATPEQQAAIKAEVGQDFTNEMRSRLEVLEFIIGDSEKYFAYVKDEPICVAAKPSKLVRLLAVTTWTGDQLATIYWQGEPHRGGFGSRRINFRCQAINGHHYSGTYYQSSENYCRLRHLKPDPDPPLIREHRELLSGLCRTRGGTP